MNYQEIYQYSINEKEKFWAEQARQLKWFKEPSNILSKNENGFDRWFADGEMNTCYLCLDHHVEQGRGEQTALIYDSPVTNTIKKYSYIANNKEQVIELIKKVCTVSVKTIEITTAMS